MQPIVKPYNLFYSNGVAILSGFRDILQYRPSTFRDLLRKRSVRQNV